MTARHLSPSLARGLVLLPACALFLAPGSGCARAQEPAQAAGPISLPEPRLDGEMSVEQALHDRRSRRSYEPDGLTLEQVGQVLWAAQGKSGRIRTAPSAGALYPIELYLVVGLVEDLEPAVYRYRPADHALEAVLHGDLRAPLRDAALGQAWVGSAPAALVVAGVVARTAAKYGARAERYVMIEAGAVAENVYLQCESLGLSTVVVGAFRDAAVGDVLELADGEAPYVIMPIGLRRSGD